MRGMGVERLGGPVVPLELSEPAVVAPDDVLIDVAAAGVGNWDEIVRTGGWDVGVTPPMALGVSAAGTVAAVGEGVTRFAPGDEVLTHPLPLRAQGTWAPRLLAAEATVGRKPHGVPWPVAAAFPVSALTADQVLREALGVGAGQTLLVHGAGGITGGMLVRLAAASGIRVLATAGPASQSRVRAYGASEVLDYRSADWPASVVAQTGGGVVAAVNAARGGAATALRAVADGGRLATITSDPPTTERAVTVAEVYVRPDGERLTDLARLLADGRLGIPIAAARPLSEAAAALTQVVGGTGGAAVVLTP